MFILINNQLVNLSDVIHITKYSDSIGSLKEYTYGIKFYFSRDYSIKVPCRDKDSADEAFSLLTEFLSEQDQLFTLPV